MLQYRGIPLFFVFVLFWYPMHCVHQRHELSVCPSVCLKPKFGRLKTKFDGDADYVEQLRLSNIELFNTTPVVCLATPNTDSVLLKIKLSKST